MRDLKILLAQTDLAWEDPERNREHLSEVLRTINSEPDVIILPEMFTTAFSMRSEQLAETMNGPSVKWMKEQANTLNSALYGSLIIQEDGRFYNRGVWMRPDGTSTCYDKRHLFRMANETDHFASGNERVIVEVEGWRMMLQICYDLRFPVFSRNREDYDALVYVANWPEVRRGAWSKLLLARAIENQAWVIGVNRVGKDANGISYSGDSVVVDPYGEVITSGNAGKEEYLEATLSCDLLPAFREKFPVAKDADNFSLDL